MREKHKLTTLPTFFLIYSVAKRRKLTQTIELYLPQKSGDFIPYILNTSNALCQTTKQKSKYYFAVAKSLTQSITNTKHMQEFLKNYLSGLVTSLVIMGAAYGILWLLLGKPLKNRKIQLSKRAGWQQIKEEIITASIAFLGSTAFMFLLFYFRDAGMLQLHSETGKYGSGYEVASVIILLLVSDAWFYWSHRAMHHPKVYKYVHALHHRSLDVNPFTSNAFHVIEAVWLTVWILPVFLLMPVSLFALGIMQALGLFNNLKSHLGYELYPQFFRIPPFNMLVTATNHSLHHTQYNGNYGLFFRFWDIACGTELNTTNSLFSDIHQRKNETVVDNTQYRTLIIDKLVKETNDTVSVYFKPTDQAFYKYQAGQYLTVKVKVGTKTYDRCFSLSSSPEVDHFLRITVKLKGEVSHYFYNEAKVGDTIESLLPVGDFILKSAPHYVMVAGGSGITPLYSMIRHMLSTETNSKITLLYANKSVENITFKAELNRLEQAHSQLQYHDFISGQKRIGKEDLSPYPDADFYICGPDSLKEGIVEQLKQLKMDKSKIHVEHYADGYVPWFGLF
jgi:ring-1,2-phenylacetyl-CoA epoxidase subunit PaaE